MKLRHLALYVSSLIWIISSCAGKKQMTLVPEKSAAAVFSGNLACHGCGDLLVMLKLNGDKTFAMELESPNEEVTRFQGTYRQKKNILYLAIPDSVKVEASYTIVENKLIPFNSEPGTQSYLQKTETTLFEKNWTLIELNGKQITPSADKERKAHILLKIISHRITGNGGCNGFSGQFELTKGNGIRISRLLSTKMACMEVKYENDFFNALADADNYLIQNDTLMFRQQESVLIKLK